MSKIYVVAVGTATIFLAACAQTPIQNVTPVLSPQLSQSWGREQPVRRSRMEGGVSKQDLLYVSNSNGEVTVYRYWQQTLVGVLTDFTQPMGECVDKNQNVYITDYAAKQILEFAHGGSKPIAKFNDSPDSPYSCWIDPTTGNLAVANDDGTSEQGNVAIWSAASGNRTTYTDSKIYNFQDCAYDDKGNLLVSNGEVEYPYSTLFAWLPKNGKKLIDVKIPGSQGSWTWYSIQGIQWDGKYFLIDRYDSLYRESLLHGQAYFVGVTYADAEEESNYGPYAVYQAKASAQGTQVVEGLTSEFSYPNQVAYWHYPAGGNEPIATISHAVDKPLGVAISLKQ
jgi:hypothetical protein